MERSYGSFHRVIGLPSGVDDSNVDASFKDGVLEVHLRKKEDTARTVTIH
jgi:HSP20 family protein